jgi:hypothetical protein
MQEMHIANSDKPVEFYNLDRLARFSHDSSPISHECRADKLRGRERSSQRATQARQHG